MSGKTGGRPELPEAVTALLRAAPVKDRAGLYQKMRLDFAAQAEPVELPELRFARITGVELARPGEWNGTPVNFDDLDTLVNSYDSGYFAAPVVLLSHETADEQFASGWVERLYWRGDTVCADFADVSPWVAGEIEEASLLYPSLMAKRDFTRLYHVVLLGGGNPAVEGLAKLKDAAIQFSVNQDEVLVFACASPEKEDNVPKDDKEKLSLGRKLLQDLGEFLGFKVKTEGEDGVAIGRDEELLKYQRQFEESETKRLALENERAEERKATRLSRAQAQVKELLDGNFITPAVADAGLAEVLAFLAEDEAKVSFSRKDGGTEEATRAERLMHAFKQLTPHRLKDEHAKADPPGGEDGTEMAYFGQEKVAFSKRHGREPTSAELSQLSANAALKAAGGDAK